LLLDLTRERANLAKLAKKKALDCCADGIKKTKVEKPNWKIHGVKVTVDYDCLNFDFYISVSGYN